MTKNSAASADQIEAVLDDAKDMLRSIERLQDEITGDDQHVRLCIVRTDMRSVVVMLESAFRAESECGGRLSSLL